MNTAQSPRWLVVVLAVALAASLALSGFNAYMALASPAQQQGGYTVPSVVGFEGFLADPSGQPLNGFYVITFTLYSSATAGDPNTPSSYIWQEVYRDEGGGNEDLVEVTDGLYSVQLGARTSFPSNAFADATWLGIKVGTDPELIERVQVSAVPWALNASQAMGLQGYPVAGSAPQSGDALLYNGTQWEPGSLTLTTYPLPSLEQAASQNTVGSTGVANRVTFWPVFFPTAVTFDRLHFRSGTGGATTGRYVGFAFYDWNGAKLPWDSTVEVTAINTNYTALGPTITLPAGAYLFAFTSNNINIDMAAYSRDDNIRNSANGAYGEPVFGYSSVLATLNGSTYTWPGNLETRTSTAGQGLSFMPVAFLSDGSW